MTEPNRQFDDPEAHVSDRLRRDLRGLCTPPGAVPARVEKAILDQAHRHLARPRRLIVHLRRAGLAAAAAIILGVILYGAALRQNPGSEISNLKSPGPVLAEGRAGGDSHRATAPLGNPVANAGRVDILAAFRLARQIESGGPVDPRWDLNGDGRVDRADVDLLARAAVRLTSGAQARRGEGVPPLRHEAILASLFSPRNAPAALPRQGQDALATNPSVSPLDKGV